MVLYTEQIDAFNLNILSQGNITMQIFIIIRPIYSFSKNWLSLDSDAAPKLEIAILKYLGGFSDPKKARQHLAVAERQESEKIEAELKGVEKRLAELEDQYLDQLYDLLRCKVLTEQEFVQANAAARTQKTDL